MADAGEKKIGALDATLLVMGGIIGVGIFFTPQLAADLVGSTWPILGVWVGGGLVALCAAFTFAELGAALPQAGGWFVYLREAFGRLPAFLFAWVVLGVVSTGAAAAVAKFGVGMLHAALPALAGGAESSGMSVSEFQSVWAAGLVTAITLVALSGVKSAVRVQNLCMLTKLLAMAALVVSAFVFVTPGADAAAPLAAVSGESGSGAVPEHGLLFGMLAALKPVFFAYGGWQMVAYIAPQVRDPERNLPRAIVTGVVAVIGVYVVANFAYLTALGPEGLAADAGFAATIAQGAGGDLGRRLISGGIAVSALGWCVVLIITSPWLYVAMAREGLFFESLGRVHPTRGVPSLALVVQLLVALVYLFASKLSFLVDAVVFVEWIFHGLVAWALLRLRARATHIRWPYKSPLYPLAPLVYLAAALLVFASTVFGDEGQAEVRWTGLTVLVSGALVYGLWSFRGRAGGQAQD